MLLAALALSLQVAIPRLEVSIQVDGALDEPVWSRAAVLTGFSQYTPADGRPAEQRTEILVWYSPTAIHFGVRAWAPPGTVRATLADRDRIQNDDTIELYLGTFNDQRQAFFFAVNPLGVQSDGSLVEGARTRGSGLLSDGGGGRESADLSPDFVFQSRGRLTESGYEIEVRIPFKSLRYQTIPRQDWSLNVIRRVAATAQEDSWTPALRSANSFLSQSGILQGLEGLRRGLVLELNPVVTSTLSRDTPDQGEFRGGEPEFGGNVRWGVTTNLTLNGTANPDFSQVEADADQINADPRSAIFFPEKRPFFLEGIEQFATPNQLVYSRRIAAPVAATKLTGKVSGLNLTVFSAVDGEETSATGLDHPIYNILRLQSDVGSQSRLGLVYTDRMDGDDYNRVAGVDGRLVFGGIYQLQVQGAVSRTRQNGVTSTGPLWQANLSRSGRTFGFRSSFRGIGPDFRALSGFIGRGDIAAANAAASVTLYGRPRALLERFTGEVVGDLNWIYDDLVDGRASLDRKLHLNGNVTLRGGWRTGVSLLVETFGYDPRLYANYAVEVPTPTGLDTIPHTGPRLPNLDWVFRLTTPSVSGFTANGFFIVGKDENFFEWSSADIVYTTLGLDYRPTQNLRFEGDFQAQIYDRRSDGTRVGSTIIPRLKVEYQLTRALFLRLVGEYRSDRRDDLRDDSRTNQPILIRDPADGIYKRSLALAFERNQLRFDWLVSWQPSPGTVFFAGYGNQLTDEAAFRFKGLDRQRDGFFSKFSYLFRL